MSDGANKADASPQPQQDAAKNQARSTVEWNDERMETSFANVVNVQGTKEQIELFFGTNRAWNAASSGPITVELSNRLILTPHAAKRMSQILNGVVQEYEARHGVLKVEDR